MSVIENPSIYDHPGSDGFFAIVQLDPVASVAAMKDARASEAAAKIPRSKYLVIMETIGYSGIELSPGVPKLELTFLQVGRGLPPDAWAAAAVSPAPTQREDRPPLVASSPLPWPDCYVYSFGCIIAIVSRLHKSSADVVCLTEDDLDRACGYTITDQMRPRRERREARTVEQADSVVAQSTALESAHSAEEQSEVAASQDADLDDSDWDSESESSWPPPPILPTTPQPPAPYQPQQMNLNVEMWLDLSTAHELSPPHQIISELTQLQSIEDEWARRKAEEIVTNRPQTTAWLEHISTGEEPPDDASIRAISDDGLGDDWEVTVEDSVDDRAERARAERRARRGERQPIIDDMQASEQSDCDDNGSDLADTEDQGKAQPPSRRDYVLSRRVYLYVGGLIYRALRALRRCFRWG